MLCFHDHCYAGRFETSHEPFGNLRGKIFLDLQAPGENIDNARHLGKADHFPVRNVGDVRPTNEWKQMMLTERIKLDVLNQYDLTRVRLEDRMINDFAEILSVSLRQKFHRARSAIGRALQTLAIQILANATKQLAIRICESSKILSRKAIALTRESFFQIKIGIVALNHTLKLV